MISRLSHGSPFALARMIVPADRTTPAIAASNRAIARQAVTRHNEQAAERAAAITARPPWLTATPAKPRPRR